MSRTRTWLFTVMVIPILSATILFKLDSFEPVALPTKELTELPQPPLMAATINDRILHGSEKLGLGVLNGPADGVYHVGKNLIYTGCEEWWIKRVTVNKTATDTVVEDWVNTGGRPLGLALGDHDEVIVANAFKRRNESMIEAMGSLFGLWVQDWVRYLLPLKKIRSLRWLQKTTSLSTD